MTLGNAIKEQQQVTCYPFLSFRKVIYRVASLLCFLTDLLQHVVFNMHCIIDNIKTKTNLIYFGTLIWRAYICKFLWEQKTIMREFLKYFGYLHPFPWNNHDNSSVQTFVCLFSVCLLSMGCADLTKSGELAWARELHSIPLLFTPNQSFYCVRLALPDLSYIYL